jgi:Holliday junction resolvasome RuvABC endonuclease subunit
MKRHPLPPDLKALVDAQPTNHQAVAHLTEPRMPKPRRKGPTPEGMVPTFAGATSLGFRYPEPAGGWPLVMGVDASSTSTGWCFMRGPHDLLCFDLVRPPAKLAPELRIDRMAEEIATLADTHKPSIVAFEWNSGKTARRAPNVSYLSTLGQAQGAVRQELRSRGHSVAAISERDWTGSRPKEKRAQVVRQIFPDYRSWEEAGKDPKLDVADAIGIAVWHCMNGLK